MKKLNRNHVFVLIPLVAASAFIMAVNLKIYPPYYWMYWTVEFFAGSLNYLAFSGLLFGLLWIFYGLCILVLTLRFRVALGLFPILIYAIVLWNDQDFDLMLIPGLGLLFYGALSLVREEFQQAKESPISENNPLDFDTVKVLVGGTAIIVIIIGFIMQYVKESQCESFTWYEYGVKKTGKVCDKDEKYRLRNNINETKKRN